MELPQKRDNVTNPIKIISWNICGLRFLLKKKSLLPILNQEDPDIVCFNETRIQQSQVETLKQEIPSTYFSYFSCSTLSKGYSGVAILSKKEPISVQLQGKRQNDQEGRTLIAEFQDFYIISTYVPCAGVKLKRLDYRVNTWDEDIRASINSFKSIKPVIWCGDLNVVNEEIDIYSLKGKEKSGCCTPEERKSFKLTLTECELVDTLRVKHPDLKVYSYYPRRNVNAKVKDQGWRLDYILVSQDWKDKVQEAYVAKYEGSDHYPVVTVLKDVCC